MTYLLNRDCKTFLFLYRINLVLQTLKATDVQLTTQEGPVTIISEEATKSSDMNDAEMQTKGDPVVQDDVSNNNSNSVNNQNDYESSDDCSSDGGSSLVDEFLADHSSHISVPLPGYSLLAVGNDDNLTISTTTTTTTTTTTATSHVTAAAKQTGSKRQIPNGCAICLCPFEATDKVTWSSNKECKHVFHADCLLNWFKTSGRRHLRRRRRQEEQSGGGNQVLSYAVDPLVKIINFPMLCPCCRQVFVVAGKDNNNNNKKVIRATVPSTTTATTTSEASSSAESVDENSADVEHGMMETEETTSNTILAAPIIAGSDDNV